MGKKVLILGNGFDLAHDLPTRYSDFLKFCNVIYEINKISFTYIQNDRVDKIQNVLSAIEKCNCFCILLKKYFVTLLKHNYIDINQYLVTGNYKYNLSGDLFHSFDISIKKMYSQLRNNIWYNYFKNNYIAIELIGDNWIDFESEISFIIQSIDKNANNLYTNNNFLNTINYQDKTLMGKINGFKEILKPFLNKAATLKSIRDILYDDLTDIIGALEVYLSEFVEKFIKPKKLDLIDQIMPDYIINFNYTHTYQNIYGGDVKPFHIHGELNHTPNNMVLGIDEYWPKKERDRHTNFTIFKKFAQRIQKRTGRDYFEIYNKLKQSDEQVKVYFFGHSLDVTDKDVLKMFLKDDSFNVTVYCVNEEAEGEYIANIIKIIGEKKLIYKVSQNPARLEFKLLNEEKELSTLGAAT